MPCNWRRELQHASSTVKYSTPKYREYSRDVRKAVVEAALSEGDWQTVVTSFKIPISTARGWIRRAQLNNNLFVDNRPRGRRFEPKVTGQMEEEMVRAVEENPQITLKEVATIVFNKFSVQLSTSTVGRHLDSKSLLQVAFVSLPSASYYLPAPS